MTVLPWDLPADRRWPVIVSDPGWKFRTRSRRGMGRSAEAWFDCMDLQDIVALPVGDLAERDSVLLLWVTDTVLAAGYAHDVIRAWGFEPKTIGFYWVKTTKDRPRDKSTPRLLDPDRDFPMGCGYYTRANPETCLLATRGRGLLRLSKSVRRLIISPRREHSRKPDEFYERTEEMYAGPYLELFARQRRSGWEAIGNEVDTGPTTQRRWRSNSWPGAEEEPAP